MAYYYTLPSNLRLHLNAARRFFESSDFKLAERAGIPESAVARFLSGETVRVDFVHRLLSVLAAMAAAMQEKGLPAESDDFTAAVEAVRMSVTSLLRNPQFASPGGPIAETSINFIRRPEEGQLLSALDNAPFIATVIGPPECGKSTLLQVLASAARFRGFAVVDFDAEMLIANARQTNEGDEGLEGQLFFAELARETGRVLGTAPEKRRSGWSRIDFQRFLRSVRDRQPAPPLLILVDHASRVSLALEELFEICRLFDKSRSQTQMSWAIEASDLAGKDKLRSISRLAPYPQVEVGQLSSVQVRELAIHYGVQKVEHINNLWDWFSGQPLLTHVALKRWHDLRREGDVAWEGVLIEIEKGVGEFNDHLERIIRRLRAIRLWDELVLMREEQFIDAIHTNHDVLKLAGAFGLLDSKSSLIRFYRHHLARIL